LDSLSLELSLSRDEDGNNDEILGVLLSQLRLFSCFLLDSDPFTDAINREKKIQIIN
jgi:hypothetical protein